MNCCCEPLKFKTCPTCGCVSIDESKPKPPSDGDLLKQGLSRRASLNDPLPESKEGCCQ